MSFKNISRSIINFHKQYYSTGFKSIITSKKGRDDSIGLIQMNRPKSLNALCYELMTEIKEAINEYDNDKNIKCIILTGSDKSFAAGADIKEMVGKSYTEVYSKNFLKEWDCVAQTTKPLVAAVNGYALGGGCELAMMCDIIYAGENAKFGQPEIKLGTIPGAGGTQRLVKALGKSRAMELVLTGDAIDAKEALAHGLVSKVFPTETLLEETIKMCNRISKMSALTLKAAKEAVLASFNTTLDQGLITEKTLFYSTFATNDRKEGMTAFVEKRDPKFTDT